nr:PIG-L family deacetylase [Bacteroidota bacterium]
MPIRSFWVLVTTLLSLHLSAQRPPEQPHAGEILHRMQKLNVLGSVLYIAAHPDDENTRLIAWLANGKKVRTGYLSLTRGEGGQNLIGSELGDPLGIIRTQELLEARRIDGGEQFFTRAVDFGYSKTAEESFAKWGKQEVLSDVVRVIRTFRPDVIITRFPTDGGGGHGHHTASAILAHEAFDLAGDPTAFPEQLEEGLEVWKPRRLFFNGSSWWRKDLPEMAKGDPKWFVVDVGGYDPLLGLSYSELAGRSRSMHKSQGFGAAETRGEQLEYLHLEKGDAPTGMDIFDGIDMTWERVKGKTEIKERLDELISSYSVTDPEKSAVNLAILLEQLRALCSSKIDCWYPSLKWRSLEHIIYDVLGLAVEGTSPSFYWAEGDSMTAVFSALQRRPSMKVQIHGFIEPDIAQLRVGEFLLPNVQWESSLSYPAPSRGFYDQPYWLQKPHGNLYNIDDPPHMGIEATVPSAAHFFSSMIWADGTQFSRELQLVYKWIDRVAGERIRPVYITPVASVIPKTPVVIATGGPQQVTVEVEALTDSLSGQLNISLPEGWMTTKDLKIVDIAKRGERQSFTFQLMPNENAKAGAVKFEFAGAKGTSDRTMHEIDYPHIMPQVWYSPAEIKLVPLDVKVNVDQVGYVKGAGDDVPQAIEELGVHVDLIDAETATLESLSEFDAIVTGIRAYNMNKELKHLNPLLMQYVENGGTLVVQYNTTPRFNVSGVSDMMIDPATIGPKEFKIGRGRVSVEEAEAKFLDPTHPLLNHPNKITQEDMNGWVQERGLYFAEELDPAYTPLIAWNDPGEEPLNGALITIDHGKGRFIYTGISFFRHLPAGVPGAYRLFANLL